jgi:capsular polysaccharide biosynthesis protein
MRLPCTPNPKLAAALKAAPSHKKPIAWRRLITAFMAGFASALLVVFIFS